MAFSNGFNGDVVSLQHILKTLEFKTILIPGVTANEDVMVTAQGEAAYIYTRGASSVGSHVLGTKLDYTSTGVKKVDVPMASGLKIGAVIPYANYQTVSADVVADKVIQEVIEITNKHNELALGAIVTGAGVVKASTGTGAYEQLVNAIAQFKIDNKKNGLKPTAALVSPAFYGELLLDQRFVRLTDVIIEGYMGKAAGVPIVEAVDMPAEADFILVNKAGIVAPMNVNTLMVTDATQAGYPGGTLIAGELGFGLKVITATEDLTLGTGYLVAAFLKA